MKCSRRDLLKFIPTAAGILAPAAASASSIETFFSVPDNKIISPNGIHLEKVELFFSDLPEDLIGYTFSFMSDIHLGGWLKDEVVEEALALAASNNSQALLLGGDLIWVPDNHAGLSDSFINRKYEHGTDEELGELVFHELSRMIRSHSFRDGVYSVLGNHDRWSNYDAYKILSQKSQTQLLLNQTATIQIGKSTIEIFGSEDLWTGIPKNPQFKKNKNNFRILLTHNPDFASFVYHKEKIEFQLALCGHTHAGQIKLPYVGALAYNITDTRYGEGLVEYGNSKFYTSRGIGWVELPVRFNCPPEVTVFTLKRS
jgi:predicted MPP superfamily phosphohydrolase